MKIMIAAATALSLATAALAGGENHVALADVQWIDAPIPGVQLAHAWGDDTTGARWLIKIEPGVGLPMHTHTHDYWGLSIQGTWVHIETDGTEVATAPGDYSLVKGGVVHADRCDGDIPCIGLLDFAGPRDVALAE
jgi:hypothetical protein